MVELKPTGTPRTNVCSSPRSASSASNVTGRLALLNSNARLLTASAKPEIAAATLSKPFTHVCPQAIKLLSFVSEGRLGWRMDLEVPDENPINPNGQGDSNEDTPDRWQNDQVKVLSTPAASNSVAAPSS